jgi:cytochrome c-type biogenesis protein
MVVTATLHLHADPLGLLVAFGAGMLSFLSPCVLPLVPGYVSMVSGLTATELRALRPTEPARERVPVVVGGSPVAAPAGAGTPDGTAAPDGAVRTADSAPEPPTEAVLRRQRASLLRGILLFIAGFTVVFTMLGASASAVGHLLLTHQKQLETVSGLLIVAFGTILVASAAGIRLPGFFAGERRFEVRPSLLGVWAPPVMGAAFAFAWTPCIGPVLGSVLGLAAGTGGSATGGIALLLAYSLGLGVPFLLFGLAFGRMTDLVARVRGRLRWVNLVGGIVLVGFGILLVTGNVAVLSAHISTWLEDLHLSRLSGS